MHVDELPTPAAIIESDAFDTNLRTMGAAHPGTRLRLFIVGTVISVRPTHAVADVGLKALGMDPGNPTVIDGDAWFFSDEHVTFTPREGARLGDRVRVIPAHIDPTMALHEAVFPVRCDEVLDRWPVDLRGWG